MLEPFSLWSCGIWTQWFGFVKGPVHSTPKWVTLVQRCAERASNVTTPLCYKKKNDQRVGTEWARQFTPTGLHPVSSHYMCVPAPHVGMSARHRWRLILIVSLEFNGKTSRERERERAGMIADGKGQRVNAFKFVFILSYWTSKPCDISLFLRIEYRSSIFIGNNGLICLLLTYVEISLYSSNHWKLTGCCMCSFHYWGEDKDLGHLPSFPFMNLNESDRIFSEHEMYCKLLMVRKLKLEENSKCRNICNGILRVRKWFPKSFKCPVRGRYLYQVKCHVLKRETSCPILTVPVTSACSVSSTGL